MVFPKNANHSSELLSQDGNNLIVSHHAPGADKWRYSLNFGTSFSDWLPYKGGNSTLDPRVWNGTKLQAWKGQHVTAQYWSALAGSSDHYQHGDADFTIARRFPNLWIEGNFNQHGFDAGLHNQLHQDKNTSLWQINFMSEWPAQVSINAWGMNPDGLPDVTQVWGDIDGDGVLDRIPPQSLLANVINVTDVPKSPYLAYRISLNDGSMRYTLVPVGSRWVQLALYILLFLIPITTAGLAVFIFMKSFYQVKFNKYGVSEVSSILPLAWRNKFQKLRGDDDSADHVNLIEKVGRKARGFTNRSSMLTSRSNHGTRENSPMGIRFGAMAADAGGPSRRVVLIATMEYDIEDWAIKIKIGGLGVMAQLMGKNLGHQDLIWVVPCVGGIDYPEDPDEESDPMIVTVLGQNYEIQVRTHTLRNITYILLDAPVFRQQTKSEPYPARMDDLDSAIYYSAWNQCIAEAIRRYQPDLYHINDYHGAVAPLHLLPDTIPCALSLHNAEFQGLWPMRTKIERDEVCRIYNLVPDVVEEYVQFGEVFNLLHAAASYLRVHQNGFGAVGVSKKYGKRSYARYPIFWGLKNIGALPNPDPSDTAEWSREDEGKPKPDAAVDPAFEAGRGALRVEAQKWAGLKEDPNAELFVFVGRWSMQKGVDLIADIFPSILERHANVQLIAIGPVIDLYGRFAAIKLEKMMSVYPGRVFSKPEFTALPPYIFSGAEFALIPSRDEPFGLVAVEFGRKGALGVGARVGGLGQMPGWWYTIESTSTRHLLQQFKGAIEGALSSTIDMRAILRARSGKQRFPVAQWVQDLETLQSTSIIKHEKYMNKGGKKHRLSALTNASGRATPSGRMTPSGRATPTFGARTPIGARSRSRARSTSQSRSVRGVVSSAPGEDPSPPLPTTNTLARMTSRAGPGHRQPHERLSGNTLTPFGTSPSEEEEFFDDEEDLRGRSRRRAYTDDDDDSIYNMYDNDRDAEGLGLQMPSSHDLMHMRSFHTGPELHLDNPSAPQPVLPIVRGIDTPTRDAFAQSESAGLLVPPRAPALQSAMDSTLSLDKVIGEKKDFSLQKTNPFFTDSKQDYAKAFERRLDGLNAKNSYSTCIEEFIEKSEKDWFNRLRDLKMGKLTPSASHVNLRDSRIGTPAGSIFNESILGDGEADNDKSQFLLQEDYKPPTGVKKFLLHKLGDWPVYSLLMAFGQIIAANSYQITLLTGEVGEAATKLYTVASIYLGFSIIWWMLYRTLKSVVVISAPFLFYGFAFVFIGIAPFVSSPGGKGWIQNVAAGCYAAASSSGSIFFALNFGDQGGAPVTSWVFRACVIQGTQQVYIAALWWWGSTLSRLSGQGVQVASLVATQPAVVTSVGVAIAVLMWVIGVVLFLGLPDYYRQTPGKVPSFLASIFRRRIVLWFFWTVLAQNFFMSAPYGRNWLYLFSSQHVPGWAIAVLVIVFFIFIWAAFLWYFSILSVTHSWILPLFAIGLGAPRWCQILWGTSNIGLYVPWAGNAVASAIAGRCLWLWLGVLDSLQGVGFGMILLHTLTRFHISFTLVSAQVLGSIATICARAFGPNALGPGPVFPDFSVDIAAGLNNGWFWVCLLSMLSINILAFMFFRKEQLSKP